MLASLATTRKKGTEKVSNNVGGGVKNVYNRENLQMGRNVMA